MEIGYGILLEPGARCRYTFQGAWKHGALVIELTRFNGERFVLNADLIEMVEATPDTVIRLLNGKKLVVKETVEQVVRAALDYARRVHCIDVPLPEEG